MDTNGFARGVHVSGNYAYVIDSKKGLITLDISDPSNLVQVGYFSIYSGAPWDTAAWNVHLSGGYAYVAADHNGLIIVDISVPSALKKVSQLYTEAEAIEVFEIQVSGNYAYLAELDDGIAVVDISDPSNPVLKHHIGWINLYSLSDT